MFSYPEKRLYILLKYLLVLVALVFSTSLSMVVLWLSSAATATGDTPAAAVSLTNHVNTGVLAPNQHRWFRIVPPNFEQNLLLVTNPASASQAFTLQIFEQTQLSQLGQDTFPSSSYGVGQWTERVGTQPAGILWMGTIDNSQTYYVRLANTSTTSVDYWLLTRQPQQDGSDQLQSNEDSSLLTLDPEAGREPHLALDLPPGRNRGRLPAGAARWYTFTRNDPSQWSHFQDLSFTLFFTPSDGNRYNVNFQLYTAREVEAWQRGLGRLNNFGAGMLTSRDDDPNTGERIWRGNILRDETYYIVIENGLDREVDYWLYDQDIIHPQLGLDEDFTAVFNQDDIALNERNQKHSYLQLKMPK
ncbi:MAG: hypothetical protein KDJ65_18680 [Anaerolineae bacterium]|nr:hypothetical protein [Anaerolineae bacterium]